MKKVLLLVILCAAWSMASAAAFTVKNQSKVPGIFAVRFHEQNGAVVLPQYFLKQGEETPRRDDAHDVSILTQSFKQTYVGVIPVGSGEILIQLVGTNN